MGKVIRSPGRLRFQTQPWWQGLRQHRGRIKGQLGSAISEEHPRKQTIHRGVENQARSDTERRKREA